ncbi:MAG: nitroreductase family protein, partial [Verrucomicrobiota bacterium]
MNTIEAIENRRSIKHYDPEHIMPEQDLAELIRLAKLSPSSFNMQNYRFVVVRDKELRQQIRAAAWDQAQVTDASVLFILCADLTAHETDYTQYWGHAPQPVMEMLGPMIKPFYDGKHQLIRDEGIRSTGLAGMTLMYAAKALGYDSCPMVGFDPVKVA